MPVDVNTLSPRELEALIKTASKRRTQLRKRKPIAVVRQKVEKMLKAEGYTREELFGASAGSAAVRTTTAGRKSTAGRTLGKVPPKYRNPDNTKETWTGRGRQPRWMAALVAEGKKPEDFLIAK
ncbi:H-NS histone family protein [Luteimonas sp. MHLX1A]|uniref:H-NS histone family protein n=1 Tax=Alterluteimonas muca TaxID=2878684 RepID=UPI001E2E82C8|nr:H-NS histone family protein [Luteimonas sp. MHLX1A]MCD9046824.1 H-NS histone family protein [Luteimonas sp. MHLX1A]